MLLPKGDVSVLIADRERLSVGAEHDRVYASAAAIRESSDLLSAGYIPNIGVAIAAPFSMAKGTAHSESQVYAGASR